jgi:ASPM-SPD-2-Hydin domain-containing protein
MLSGLIREINKLLGIDFGPSSASTTNPSIAEGPALESDQNSAESLPLQGDFFQSTSQSDLPSPAGPRQGAEKLFGPLPILAYLSPSTSSLPFGDVNVNSGRSLYFSVTNNSDQSVSVNLSSPPTGFTVSPCNAMIGPHGSWSFSVTFNPTTAQDYSGYINVNPGGLSVFVSGKGTKN